MGMFNCIIADLRCPVAQEVGSNAEIQIKWQIPEQRALTAYRLGDVLEDIEDEFDNTWVRTDYICEVCSKQTASKNGGSFIRIEDQQRHFVFVNINEGKVCKILSEQEFENTGITDFVNYW